MRTKIYIVVFCLLSSCLHGYGQLSITPESNANNLAQMLVGNGVSVFNASITGSAQSSCTFTNPLGNSLGIQRGIALSTGRVLTGGGSAGLTGNQSLFASSSMGVPGDANLSQVINGSITYDAIILEFDFVPLGNSVSFKYVFSSEEYPEFNCSPYNDVFAFFISGPGFPTPKNIALVPGQNIPVSINSINDGIAPPGGSLGICNSMGPGSPFTSYYINNTGNSFFTHDGCTFELEAFAVVQPCQVYHLKIAIADAVDRIYDSAVFLEANSLSAYGYQAIPDLPVDGNGNFYLAEGCNSGSFIITPPRTLSVPQPVNLFFEGTAINGTDITTIPSQVIIPPNQSELHIPVSAIVDNLPEGTEVIKIYLSPPGCTGNIFYTDTLIIEIRDFDRIHLDPGDSVGLCRNSSVNLEATGMFDTFSWNADPTLSNINIPNPVATPVNSRTVYTCTGRLGTCNSRDSAILQIKDIGLAAKTNDSCATAPTGKIKTIAGWEWKRPLQFSLNNGPWQADSTFSNLAVGTYVIKVRDTTFCVDSITVNITPVFPSLAITENITGSSCSGLDGHVSITGNGGMAPYQYAVDIANFTATSTHTLTSGAHVLFIKDQVGCRTSKPITVPVTNSIQVDAGADPTICEGKNITLPATSNGVSFSWQPAATLNDPTRIDPTAKPAVTTKYYLTAIDGICSRTDSVTVFVNPAPIPNAGRDTIICTGKTITLNGSGGVAFEWSPATYLNSTVISNPRTTPAATIGYALKVTDALGCTSLQPAHVQVSVQALLKISAGPDVIAGIGQPVQLTAVDLNNNPNISFSWQPAIRLSNSGIFNPIALAETDITYRVTATDASGCTGSDEVFIKTYKGPEIYVPGAFTPNRDGLNDRLFAIAVGVQQFKYFTVYNKWGQVVFTTQNVANGWDGTFNGMEQPGGAFIWMAEAIDYKGNIMRRKGTVLLLR